MGRKLRVSSDQALMSHHDKGASVVYAQPLVHSKFGAICFIWPRFWILEWKLARKAQRELCEVHDEILNVPVGRDNMRLLDVDDGGLAVRAFDAGSRMVTHTVRSVQQLCTEIERVASHQLEGRTLEERIKEAATVAELQLDSSSPWYGALVEIVGIRDAMEHPHQDTSYNARPRDWDRVPLAWFISERGLAAYDRFESGFEALVARWETRVAEMSVPGTLRTAARGIRSEMQYKKPPRPTEA